MNNSRRSMRLQAEHKNVWCSNPGSVVGPAGTASSNASQFYTPSTESPLVLHQWADGAEGARDDQARPRPELSAVGGPMDEPATPLIQPTMRSGANRVFRRCRLIH